MNPAESDAIRILGVRIDRVTYDEALAHVELYLSEGGFHQIATVNPEFVVLAQQDAAFRGVLNATALNVPDGVGLLWAARRLGQPLPGRVTGQELVDRIAARAARTGERVFMLGARPGVAEKAGGRTGSALPAAQHCRLLRRLAGSERGTRHSGAHSGRPCSHSIRRVRATETRNVDRPQHRESLRQTRDGSRRHVRYPGRHCTPCTRVGSTRGIRMGFSPLPRTTPHQTPNGHPVFHVAHYEIQMDPSRVPVLICRRRSVHASRRTTTPPHDQVSRNL